MAKYIRHPITGERVRIKPMVQQMGDYPKTKKSTTHTKGTAPVNTNDIALIKWPCLLVVGKSITERQAAEILIRTDRSLPDYSYAGNDQDHERQLSALFGAPTDDPDMTDGSDMTEPERQTAVRHRHTHWAAMEELGRRTGKLELEYLTNSQIVSSWVGGPHGWCSWSGEIGCNTFNIGKWPSVETVHAEWQRIAAAFPFLELQCQLLNHECGYPATDRINGPVVKFVIGNGKAEAVVQDPSKDFMIAGPREEDFMATHTLDDMHREQGITVEGLAAKLRMVYGEIPQYRDGRDDRPGKP